MPVQGGTTIPFDNLADKNALATKVRTLLDQIPEVFRKRGMTLDQKRQTFL
jgi:hypothetical protein